MFEEPLAFSFEIQDVLTICRVQSLECENQQLFNKRELDISLIIKSSNLLVYEDLSSLCSSVDMFHYTFPEGGWSDNDMR